jgi:hypothetical protein
MFMIAVLWKTYCFVKLPKYISFLPYQQNPGVSSFFPMQVKHGESLMIWGERKGGILIIVF